MTPSIIAYLDHANTLMFLMPIGLAQDVSPLLLVTTFAIPSTTPSASGRLQPLAALLTEVVEALLVPAMNLGFQSTKSQRQL
jgi:hypothetical protein